MPNVSNLFFVRGICILWIGYLGGINSNSKIVHFIMKYTALALIILINGAVTIVPAYYMIKNDAGVGGWVMFGIWATFILLINCDNIHRGRMMNQAIEYEYELYLRKQAELYRGNTDWKKEGF